MIEIDQEPMESRPWLIVRTLVRAERGRVPVRVINVMPEPVNIKAGAHLAVLQPLDKEITVVPAQQRIRQVNTSEPEQVGELAVS